MGEPVPKRRKVRKGTHSCWECRRRKTRCQFAEDDDETICIGCQARGSSCVSQKFDHAPLPSTDRCLAQRLGRLEEMMGKLVDQSASTSTTESPNGKLPSPPGSEDSALSRQHQEALDCTFEADETDLFGSSAARSAQAVTLMNSSTEKNPVFSPATPSCECITYTARRAAKYQALSKKLHSLFPSHETLRVLTHASPGANLVLAVFYSKQDLLDGKVDSLDSLATVPDVSSHPALLAKRLIQLAICIQQIPQCFDSAALQMAKPPLEAMEEWVAVVAHVTSNDDLIGSLEGLETLVMLSFYQSETGHLRKSWMTVRRALSMSQLMGLSGRRTPCAIHSCDPKADPSRFPSPISIKARMACADRFTSLMLGLPIGSRDNSWAEHEGTDTPLETLGKTYSIIAGRVAERNEKTGSEAYAMTQAIDLELEEASHLMQSPWWELPDMTAICSDTDAIWPETTLMLQMRHYLLLLLLHLPYLVRERAERRYDYNRTTCMRASRAILERFLQFRAAFTGAHSARGVDYGALVSAMTLLLGHVVRRGSDHDGQREADRELVETVKDQMLRLAVLNNDRLSAESAETVTELLPILQTDDTGGKDVHLTIPFLGTVNIMSQRPQTSGPLQGLDIPSSCPSGYCPSTHPSAFSAPPISLSVDRTVPPPAFGDQAGLEGGGPANGCIDFGSIGWPFTADTNDWALQGVDTTYWSTLNNGMS